MDSKIMAWIGDIIDRLFERETLAVLIAFYLVETGRVNSIEEAALVAVSVLGIIGGRSYVKANTTPVS